MDTLQGVAAAIELAELARKTAVFLHKVYHARKDAEELCRRMENLSQLMRTVNRTLERRRERQGSRVIDFEDLRAEDTINSSLKLCSSWLEGIYKYFKPLVEKDSGLTRKEITARFKFVIKQDYIAAQERKINMHLSTLSISLTTLLHEDNGERMEREEADRKQRARAQQRQHEIHEAFLQQLLHLFKVVFNSAQTAASPPPRRTSHHTPHSSTTSNQMTARSQAAIKEYEEQQTLEDLFFGPTFAREDPFRQFQFHNIHSLEQQDDHALIPTNTQLAIGDAELQAEIDHFITDEQDLYRMDRSLTVDMTNYASETTLVLAIKQGQSSIISSLINAGADVTTPDIHGWTLLHYAVFYLREEIIDILLSQSSCQSSTFLNAQTKLGETALIFAVQRAWKIEGYNIAVKLLDQPTCDVNITDGQEGYSALYYAVSQGKPSNKPRRELVRILASKNADVQLVNEITPERVSYFDFLSSYIETVSDDGSRRDSTASFTRPNAERKDSSASLKTRRESNGGKFRRLSLFKKRTNSYSAQSE